MSKTSSEFIIDILFNWYKLTCFFKDTYELTVYKVCGGVIFFKLQNYKLVCLHDTNVTLSNTER